MEECAMYSCHNKYKARLRRIDSPSTPRFRNLHLDLLWLHASCRNDRPTTPTLPPHLRSIVSVCESTTAVKVVFLPLPPRSCASLPPSSTSARCDPTTRTGRSRLHVSLLFGTIQAAMTAYHLTAPTTLPSFAVSEAKAKRRQVLARAAQTRKANYEQFVKKRRLQANSDLV